MAEPELLFHPLFPPSEDADPDDAPPDVQEIVVQRKENGRLVTAPRLFLPSELVSVQQLHAEYGGGEYHLTARNHRKQFQGKVLQVLPGISKPLFDDGIQPGQAKPVATPLNPMMAAMGAAGGDGIMPLIMMMMQQMMASSAAAAAQQTQMFMAMMQNTTQMSVADKQAQADSAQRQREADQKHSESMMLMMRELSQVRGAGNSTGGEEAFFKGVEFMRHFSTQQVEMIKQQAKSGGDFDLEGLLQTGLEALQGFQAFKEMAGTGPAAAVAEVVR